MKCFGKKHDAKERGRPVQKPKPQSYDPNYLVTFLHKINRDIFQDDAFSSLIFFRLALLSHALNNTRYGYQTHTRKHRKRSHNKDKHIDNNTNITNSTFSTTALAASITNTVTTPPDSQKKAHITTKVYHANIKFHANKLMAFIARNKDIERRSEI